MSGTCASSELVRAYADSDRDAPHRVVRASRSSRLLAREVTRLSCERVPVLVVGETGTGKTLVAKELHPQGASLPLVTINCASLGDTQLAHVVHQYLTTAPEPGASGPAVGTLLLDEVGELSPWAQAVLLRALTACPAYEGPRLVAATHRDLESMVRSGGFSGELLLRLRGVTLHIPPLRERRDEIAALATHFLRLGLAASGRSIISFEPRVLQQLEQHDWPGNVRELQNTIHHALTLCNPTGRLDLDALPDELRSAAQNV